MSKTQSVNDLMDVELEESEELRRLSEKSDQRIKVKTSFVQSSYKEIVKISHNKKKIFILHIGNMANRNN